MKKKREVLVEHNRWINRHGKRITYFVIVPDFDVDFAGPQVDEGQFGHVLPNLESFGKFAVHVGSLQGRRVFRNAVRQLFYTPTATCWMQNRRFKYQFLENAIKYTLNLPLAGTNSYPIKNMYNRRK